MGEELAPIYQTEEERQAVKRGIDTLVASEHIRQSNGGHYFKLRHLVLFGEIHRDAFCEIKPVNGGLQLGILGRLDVEQKRSNILMEELSLRIGFEFLIIGENEYSFVGKRVSIDALNRYYELESLRPIDYHSRRQVPALPRLERFLVRTKEAEKKQPKPVGFNWAGLIRQPGVNVVENRAYRAVVNQDGQTIVFQLCANEYGVCWLKTEDYPQEAVENPHRPFGLQDGDDSGWTYEYQPGELQSVGGSGEGNHIARTRKVIAESGMTERQYFARPSRGGPQRLTNKRRKKTSVKRNHKVPGGKRRRKW